VPEKVPLPEPVKRTFPSFALTPLIVTLDPVDAT
jgi:hypothetical protein